MDLLASREMPVGYELDAWHSALSAPGFEDRSEQAGVEAVGRRVARDRVRAEARDHEAHEKHRCCVAAVMPWA